MGDFSLSLLRMATKYCSYTAKKPIRPTVSRRSTDGQGLRHYRNSAFSCPKTAQILRTYTILYILYIIYNLKQK